MSSYELSPLSKSHGKNPAAGSMDKPHKQSAP
jgi:hypothetical protein